MKDAANNESRAFGAGPCRKSRTDRKLPAAAGGLPGHGAGELPARPRKDPPDRHHVPAVDVAHLVQVRSDVATLQALEPAERMPHRVVLATEEAAQSRDHVKPPCE